LACPFFVPREILTDGAWLHPMRLPLGAGWRGSCCARGQEFIPDDAIVHDFCNLGYAAGCPHLPAVRDWDAIRFSVARTSVGQITLHYVCESAHAPSQHGKLTYDLIRAAWVNPHSDPRVQRLATCYIESFRSRQNNSFIE
jgi:hypothetical protein